MGINTAIFINDLDLSSLGLVVEHVNGWLDSPSATDRTTQLPGRVGALILAPETETAPRNITIEGLLRRSSAAAVRRSIDQLKAAVTRGTIEVRFIDQQDRVVYARTQDIQVVATQPQFASAFSRVSIRLLVPDPLIYDTKGSIIGFTAATPTPLGTAVSAPTIRIMGPVTNPVVTYRRADGTVVDTMGFTIALTGSDYLEINCEVDVIKKSIAGVQSVDMNLLTSGSFISLDPQDGDSIAGSYPSLSLSGGTGEALYRKAWL